MKRICIERLIRKSVQFVPNSNLNSKYHVGRLLSALQYMDSRASALERWLRRGTIPAIVPTRALATTNRPNNWTLQQLYPPCHRPLLRRLQANWHGSVKRLSNQTHSSITNPPTPQPYARSTHPRVCYPRLYHPSSHLTHPVLPILAVFPI